MLRAPWCGLVLADLFVLDSHLQHGLPGLFKRLDAIEGLSDDGRARVARIASVLTPAFEDHGRVDIADRVRGAWLAIGGPATIDDAVDFGAVEDFLALLRSHATGGDIDDWQALQDELAVRFVTSAEEAITPVKVMTLFRAKGLEFDAVIIPGLARTPPPDDTNLLRWRTRKEGLLLASVGGRGGSPIRSTTISSGSRRPRTSTNWGASSSWGSRARGGACTSWASPKSRSTAKGCARGATHAVPRRWAGSVR